MKLEIRSAKFETSTNDQISGLQWVRALKIRIFNLFRISNFGFRIYRFSGFTLIEIVIVILLLGTALPGLMFYFFHWREGLSDTRLRSVAAQLCHDLMEEIASKKWDENKTSGPVGDAQKTPADSLGPEAGESRYASGVSGSFDDVDDYNGLSESPPKDSGGNDLTQFAPFVRSASVAYVDLDDLDAAVTASPPPNYKRVRVQVSWRSGSQHVEAVDVFSNY